jgi:hypothetical protein
MLQTHNVTTGEGPALLPGRGAISATTQRAPTRLFRRADQVGMPRLPILEPFGLSFRSCCLTGRLMRSWFIEGELSGSEALIFPAALASSKSDGFSSAGVGAGQGRVEGERRTAHAPETPDGSLRIKLIYSVTVGPCWGVVFPSCKVIFHVLGMNQDEPCTDRCIDCTAKYMQCIHHVPTRMNNTEYIISVHTIFRPEYTQTYMCANDCSCTYLFRSCICYVHTWHVQFHVSMNMKFKK